MNPWTPAAVAMITKLWGQGRTGREIMHEMNAAGHGPFSRPAIIGKARRLGLERRPSPLNRPVEAHQPAKVVEVPRNRCQWPYGHPRQPEFRFCGAKAVTERPYCEEHCREAYQGYGS